MYQIRREMPATELADWYAHFRIVAEDQERERKKAKR